MLKASCGSTQAITFLYNGPCAKPTEQGRNQRNHLSNERKTTLYFHIFLKISHCTEYFFEEVSMFFNALFRMPAQSTDFYVTDKLRYKSHPADLQFQIVTYHILKEKVRSIMHSQDSKNIIFLGTK